MAVSSSSQRGENQCRTQNGDQSRLVLKAHLTVLRVPTFECKAQKDIPSRWNCTKGKLRKHWWGISSKTWEVCLLVPL